jgi:endoglucanase
MNRKGMWLGAWLALASRVASAQCDASATAVELNQIGFITGGPKLAVVVSAAAQPLAWALTDSSGKSLATGSTRIVGADAASGQSVHKLDFSAWRKRGENLRLQVGCARSHAFVVADHPFESLKRGALAYFYHNRASVPIEARFAGGEKWARPVAHADETATCRAGKDRFGNEWPGCSYSLNPIGGWYDAGDQGKYVVNGGISVWTLLNLYERQQTLKRKAAFGDRDGSIPESGNRVDDLLDEARFEIEFLLRMQAPTGSAAMLPVGVKRNAANLQFVRIDASGMAHHKIADMNWTAVPTPPHLDREQRVLHAVSTAATLNLAAVAAQCARIWKSIDQPFAARCLSAARAAYDAAQRNPQVYFISDFTGSGMYGDGELADEFFWAAAELVATTGERHYLDDVRAASFWSAELNSEPSWGGVAALGLASLATVPTALPAAERGRLRGVLVAAAERFAAEREQSGYGVPFVGKSYVWGSNSNLLNRGILLGLAHDFSREPRFRDAVVDVADYLLGRNPLGQSYVSGFGTKAMRRPHHRFWTHSVDASLPEPPPGALSGGPNANTPAESVARRLKESGCAPQTCWADEVEAYSLNEVAINWNAPLVWVAAFLDEDAH